mmetsp:Transcript_11588/g.17829  ORF Transcript_11588/g.17829 Transcript_11588/m.17829 type:complete len:505 (+) Transcript_11588:109-1623(+)
MTSIPADPGLVLGNIIEPERIENLKAIALAQAPLDAANDRLNNLLRNTYKIQLIFQQMVNMMVDPLSLVEIQAELIALKAEAAEAAVDLAKKTIEAEKKVRDMKAKNQTKITKQIESPLNYDACDVKQFPLSFDSLKFDVQFFQVARSADASTAHATTVGSHVAASMNGSFAAQASMQMGASATTTTMAQVNTNDVDGTIVITAYANHKETDIISPFVMDAEKAVTAWNWCNSDDRLKTGPQEMWEAALDDKGGKEGSSLQILSGVAKSSSFVGFVHILKSERTVQSSVSASVAASVAATMYANMGQAAAMGSFGVSSEVSSTVSSMLSTANLTSNCSMQCEGVIPSIVSNTIETTVQNMSPDPKNVMAQLGAIADASSISGGNEGGGGLMGSMAGNAKTGAQFIELNNSYLKNVVSSLGEQTRLSNKVIDTNTMMTAFEDYVKKAMEGKCGVPTAFFIKDLKKSDVAKCFIRKYYPNGATNQTDAMDGQLGINSGGKNPGDEK